VDVDMDVEALLNSAANGDQTAWDLLVERYTNLLWSIACAYRLIPADASDVVQTTWLKLVENLGRITDPQRLPAWLASTTRRECLQLLRRTGRQRRFLDLDSVPDLADPGPAVDDPLLRAERDAALWRALATLSERCQRLLRILMASPPPAYAEVAEALDVPVGSIGPTRGRCLDRLRDVVLADDVFGSERDGGRS
jgi:RNA polymerase sigma factor (sigma-70 family)